MSFNPDTILEKITARPPIPITQEEVFAACEKVTELLVREGNALQLSSPIITVGDIHGQLYDFLEIFNMEAPPPFSKYLFLGDYVDRGYYSLEVLMYLVCLKIKYPSHVYLLRGNHESSSITFTYGFYQECLEKFGNSVVCQTCCNMFNFLPIAALIGTNVFCCHGGLSPSIHLIDQINSIHRFCEPIMKGPLSDLLWSDPDKFVTGFQISPRGDGYLFGPDVTARFHHLNKTQTMIRAHQLVHQGYDFQFDYQVLTVWSAPNYCYKPTNYASVCTVSHKGSQTSLDFNVYAAVPQSERVIPPSKSVMSQYFV